MSGWEHICAYRILTIFVVFQDGYIIPARLSHNLVKPHHNSHFIMDSGRYGPRAVDAADPVSYETWPTLAPVHQQQRSSCSPCSLRRLTWTSVSVLELILMILTVVFCFFLPKKYLEQIVRAGQINDLSEWVLRMYGSMICVQIALLVAGIGWGDTISRKIIYWGMLTGDILLLAIQASFVHSMSKWNAVNIAIVTTASAFGLFRIITLILNPRWWEWAPEPII